MKLWFLYLFLDSDVHTIYEAARSIKWEGERRIYEFTVPLEATSFPKLPRSKKIYKRDS